MRQFNYKCVVSKNGTKMYYKRVKGKWKRISNKVGKQAEKGKKKYRIDEEWTRAGFLDANNNPAKYKPDIKPIERIEEIARIKEVKGKGEENKKKCSFCENNWINNNEDGIGTIKTLTQDSCEKIINEGYDNTIWELYGQRPNDDFNNSKNKRCVSGNYYHREALCGGAKDGKRRPIMTQLNKLICEDKDFEECWKEMTQYYACWQERTKCLPSSPPEKKKNHKTEVGHARRRYETARNKIIEMSKKDYRKYDNDNIYTNFPDDENELPVIYFGRGLGGKKNFYFQTCKGVNNLHIINPNKNNISKIFKSILKTVEDKLLVELLDEKDKYKGLQEKVVEWVEKNNDQIEKNKTIDEKIKEEKNDENKIKLEEEKIKLEEEKIKLEEDINKYEKKNNKKEGGYRKNKQI